MLLAALPILGAAAAGPSAAAAADATHATGSASTATCLGLSGSAAAPSTVVLASCSGPTLSWTQDGSRLRAAGGCLADVNGSPVIESCDGSSAQRWTASGGALRNAASRRCLALPAATGRAGTPLTTGVCDGSAAQQWNLTSAGGPPFPWLGVGEVVLAALLCSALVIALAVPKSQRALTGPLTRRVARLRARLPKRPRRLSPLALAMVAGPGTAQQAEAALRAAGRGATWAPFAAVVGRDEVEVWFAGVNLPEPPGPWRADPADPLVWRAGRAALDDVPVPAANQGPEILPLTVGVLGEGAVVMDLAQSYGLLVVAGESGAEVPAGRVALVLAYLRARFDGGEVLFATAADPDPGDGRPCWRLEAAEDGAVSLHGRRFFFAPTLADGLGPEPGAAPYRDTLSMLMAGPDDEREGPPTLELPDFEDEPPVPRMPALPTARVGARPASVAVSSAAAMSNAAVSNAAVSSAAVLSPATPSQND